MRQKTKCSVISRSVTKMIANEAANKFSMKICAADVCVHGLKE